MPSETSNHTMRETRVSLGMEEDDDSRSQRRSEDRDEKHMIARALQAQVDHLTRQKAGTGGELQDVEDGLEREWVDTELRE